jgi:hypothetical protein
MELLILYCAFAAALGWTGHVLTQRWKYPSASAVRRRLLLATSAALFLTGLWLTNVVAFSVWAGGGPDTARKDAHLVRARWALAFATVSFLAAGAAWPRRAG